MSSATARWFVTAALVVTQSVILALGVSAQRPQLSDELVPSSTGWSFVPGGEAPTASSFATWDGTLFKGTEDQPVSYVRTGALFSSSDDGETWTHTGVAGPITQLVGSPRGLVAVAGGLFYHSRDGQTWQEVIVPGGVVAGVTAANDVLLALTGGYSGLFLLRSLDGGLTWSQLPAPNFGFAQLTAVQDRVFAGNSNGLFRSSDLGMSWQAVESFPHDPKIMRMAEVDGILFVVQVGNGTGLYRSVDRGDTWQFVTNGVPNDPYGLLRAITSHEDALYVSVTGTHVFRGLHVSHDQGQTWTRIVIPGLSNQYVTALHSTGASLIAGTPEGTFRSDDAGATWERSDAGSSSATGVSGIHAANGRIVAGVDIGNNWGRGIWWTDDHGSSWQQSPQFPQMHARTFHSYGGELLAAGFGNPRGIIRSTDGGANWSLSNDGMAPGTVLYDVVDHGGTLLAGTFDALYQSTDGGHSWAADGHAGFRSLINQRRTLYAAHYGAGVFRSTDRGQSWTLFAQSLTGDAKRGERLLAHDGTLFLGTDGLGVWRLDGDQWTHIGPGNARVTTMVEAGGTIVIGTKASPYLYVWRGGAQWEPFDQGIAPRRITALVSDGAYVYAGLALQGLWRRPVADVPSRPAPPVPFAATSTAEHISLGLYPNPTSASTQLALDLGASASGIVQLLDVMGREVTRWEVDEAPAGVWRQTIDTSRLASGIYLLRALVGGETVVFRLTVAH